MHVKTSGKNKVSRGNKSEKNRGIGGVHHRRVGVLPTRERRRCGTRGTGEGEGREDGRGEGTGEGESCGALKRNAKARARAPHG